MKDYLTGAGAKDAEEAGEHESEGNGVSELDNQTATAEESDSSEDEV